MGQLPTELVEQILEQFVRDHQHRKNAILPLRLVCRAFDRFLAPILLKTLQLDFLRLKGSWSDPDTASVNPHVLAQRGYLAQALNVDTMIVRDIDELEYMGAIFDQVTDMQTYIPWLRQQYSMSEHTFTPVEFRQKLNQMLLYTPNLERLSLNLPYQLFGCYSDASTMILSNALAALAENLARGEKDPDLKIADLKVLVLENVASVSLLQLWNNPIDVRNIAAVFRNLEHIAFGIRRQDRLAAIPADMLGERMWDTLGMSGKMKSICISSLDNSDIPPGGLKESCVEDNIQAAKLVAMALPFWRNEVADHSNLGPEGLNKPTFNFLRSLEFRRLDLCGRTWMHAMKSFPALEELYLRDVYLQTLNESRTRSLIMWIGYPDERPPENHCWIALHLRLRRPRLRIVRAHNLAYHRISTDHARLQAPIYDLPDPSNFGRDVSQRFVEVVMGYQQPCKIRRTVCDLYLPAHGWSSATMLGPELPLHSPKYLEVIPERDHLVVADMRRPDGLQRIHTCAVYHQLMHGDPKGGWSQTIDGWFPNCNSHTFKELHTVIDKACHVMKYLNHIKSEQINKIRQAHAHAQSPPLP